MAKRKPHEKVETWIVVTIISVLVWLYAEATVLQERTGLSVQLRITEATEGYAITPDAETVRVSYRASSGQIQQFNEATGIPLIHEIDVTDVTTKTERTLILDEVLIRAGLGDIGITELTVEPETLTIAIQPLVTVELPVAVESEGLNLSGEPTTEPAFVTVTVPQETADSLKDLDQPVTARLSRANVRDGTGLEQFATIPLEFSEALDLRSPWVTVPVRDVGVNFTLANETATVTVGRVPIYINLPVDAQLRYTVQPADPTSSLLDVELRGPADVIARIRAGELPVRAELSITDLTKIEQTSFERPVLITPPGVTPVQPPEVMALIVRRRDAPPGS